MIFPVGRGNNGNGAEWRRLFYRDFALMTLPWAIPDNLLLDKFLL